MTLCCLWCRHELTAERDEAGVYLLCTNPACPAINYRRVAP